MRSNELDGVLETTRLDRENNITTVSQSLLFLGGEKTIKSNVIGISLSNVTMAAKKKKKKWRMFHRVTLALTNRFRQVNPRLVCYSVIPSSQNIVLQV